MRTILKHLLTAAIAAFVAVNAHAAKYTVNISCTDRTVAELVSMLTDQTGQLFSYSSAVGEKRVSRVRVIKSNVEMEEILKAVFGGSGIDWKVNGSMVVLVPSAGKAGAERAEATHEELVPAIPEVRPEQELIEKIDGKVVVSGVVREADGTPVIGAGVRAMSSGAGVVTDLEGRYTIEVNQGETLLFDALGYGHVSVDVGNRRSVDVVMKSDELVLDASVVVGYGVQRKESVVGAVVQIDNDAIVGAGQSNVTQAIAGKLSGVLTMQNSGMPGSDNATILVRGVSSWNGSAPLVMVDGVEREFNDLDPNEIASLSVLKDASATAVFGAKGANGVILVTTRQGAKGKPRMKVSLSQSYNFPTGIPNHVSAYETAQAFNVALKNNGQFSALYSDADLEQYRHPSSALNALRYPDVDWYKMLMRKCSPETTANLNFSGGTDRVKYFFSLGYKTEGSIFKEFKDGAKYSYDRINYRSNLDFDITKSTILSFRVGGSLGIQQSPSSPISAMYSTSTILFPAYFPAWVLEEIPDPDYPDANALRRTNSYFYGSYYGNPYGNLSLATYNQYTDSKLFTDLLLDQKLDKLIPGLSLKGKFSFSTYMRRLSESVSNSLSSFALDWAAVDAGTGNPWVPSQSTTIVLEDPPYSASQGNVTTYNYTLYWEGSLNYNQSWNNHHVTALALFQQKEYVSRVAFPYRNEGLVGRVTYDYHHKYLFEGNLGYTGSEQFAPSNRFGFFPSVAVGYVVSNETFWKKAFPWWNKFKLRYSDGLVGSDKTDSRWLYFSSFNSTSTGYIYESESANDNARWETARKRDIGIEMAWLKNRLSLEVDLFDEHRSGMLVTPMMTLLVGASSKEVNRGALKKHGFEAELHWKDKLPGGFEYHLDAMYSFNENRITNYEDAPYTPEYQKVAGKPHAGQSYGETLVDGGYFTSVDDIHNYIGYTSSWDLIPVGAYKYLDYKADGRIDTNDMHAVLGSRYPSTLVSFGGGFTWKRFDFSFLFYGNLGKWVNYNGAYEIDFTHNEIRLSESQRNYWSPDNPGATHATMVYRGASGHPMYTWAGITSAESADMGLVGHTWRRSDYVNLRDLRLGYTFDSRKLNAAVGIKSLNVYINVNNLFYFTTLLEGNPEASSFVSGSYPLMRTLQLGFKLGI